MRDKLTVETKVKKTNQNEESPLQVPWLIWKTWNFCKNKMLLKWVIVTESPKSRVSCHLKNPTFLPSVYTLNRGPSPPVPPSPHLLALLANIENRKLAM